MKNRLSILFALIIVVIPLLSGGYLFYIADSAKSSYDENNNSQVLINAIRKAEDIEVLRETTIQLSRSRDKEIDKQFDYFKSFSEGLFVMAFINLVFLYVMIAKLK